MKILILGLIFFISCPLTGKAEPDTAIEYLTKEKASMLDFGIARLEDHLQKTISQSIFILYDIDKNRLILTDINFNSSSKETAKTAFKYIRGFFNVDPQTGKPGKQGSSLTSYFGHQGYSYRNEPENLEEKLATITLLRFIGKDFKCESPLLSTEILCSEDKK